MFARLKHAAAVFAAVAVVARAYAPSDAAPAPSPAPSATPKTLDAIVVTADRHPEKLRDASRETYVLYQSDLVRLGARTVADALRFVPGSVVTQYGVYGSLATVALRGASTADTLVLIDGRPANEADTGQFDFSSEPVSVVERVEVVEGGASTLYGSAAVGGVINIITRTPSSAPVLSAFLQTGYQGEFERGVGVSATSGTLGLRLEADSEAANNVFDYPPQGSQPGGTRSNDDATIKHLSLSASDKLGAFFATLQLGDDASAIGAPGAVGPFASLTARQLRVYQRAALEIDGPLAGGDVSLELSSDGKRLRFYDLAVPFDTDADGSDRRAALRWTRALGAHDLLTIGAESHGDVGLFNAGIPGQPAQLVHAAQTAWFAQDELHRGALTVTAGLRHEGIQGTLGADVPSLGIREDLGQRWQLRANYARAFRAPTLDERYYPFYGNPRLQPEYAATFDLEARTELARGEATLTYFGSDTNNLIVNVPIDQFGDVAPYNVNRAVVRGLATNIDTRIGSQWHGSLSYTDFLEAADRSPFHPTTRLQYRPTADGSLALWRGQRGWDYGVQEVFVGHRFADEANTLSLRPYLLTSLFVRREVTRDVSATLRVDNLEDDRLAQDEYGYPVIGRRLSLRLALR